MTSHDNGFVRVTNQTIYEEQLKQGRMLDRLDRAIEDVLKPGVNTALARTEALDKNKADKTETVKLDAAISSVRTQTYAIVGGVLAGLVALRTLGVI